MIFCVDVYFWRIIRNNLLGKEIGYRGIKLIWEYCVKFLKCIGVKYWEKLWLMCKKKKEKKKEEKEKFFVGWVF